MFLQTLLWVYATSNAVLDDGALLFMLTAHGTNIVPSGIPSTCSVVSKNADERARCTVRDKNKHVMFQIAQYASRMC